jgi:gliding motility-associated protein GldM
MAGVKETPRQKMIGMMYLVLTALLALNVSSETLQKFVFLNSSLENQVRDNVNKHERLVAGIATQVSELGNRKEDQAVLERAQRVREATNQVISFTDDLKNIMIKESGGLNEDGTLRNAQDMDKIANYMINKGNGVILKNKLNEYASYLSQEMGTEFPPIAYDGRDHPMYQNDKEQRTKDFSTLSFHYTPTAASLATVTQLQSQVMEYETKALDILAREVGAKDLSFDVITPMVRAKSNIVAAGTKYEAEMFIAASATGMNPEMFRNGAKLPVVDGKGRVEFIASGGNYDNEGLSRQTYTAEIKLKDTTLTQVVEYFVARPVIQIQSAAVQALYLNCGNELNVQVPALGALYNPSFSASGAAAIPGSRRGLVTLVPTGKEVVLNVSSSGVPVGSEKFPVRNIPLPGVVVKSGNSPINMMQGVPAPGPRSITLDVVPDESFATFLPRDARYRVTEYEVTLGRGTQAVARRTSNSPTVDLTQFAQQARAGDRLVIEIKEVQRMNFRDQIETVRMPVSATVYTVPLN